jgi:hypothetical protein
MEIPIPLRGIHRIINHFNCLSWPLQHALIFELPLLLFLLKDMKPIPLKNPGFIIFGIENTLRSLHAKFARIQRLGNQQAAYGLNSEIN